MSIPGVLFAIPWLVLLWHALGLVGIRFASAFIDVRQNWCVVMCLFSLWWQRSVRGASFVEWWFDTVLLVRMVVRMGGVSQFLSRNIKTHSRLHGVIRIVLLTDFYLIYKMVM